MLKSASLFRSLNRNDNTSLDMTTCPLWSSIIRFSVPLMISQVLQVLFNMADVAVVGKFSTSEALGSVGSTSTLIMLFTGFLIGMGCGVNVKAAQYLGAKSKEDLTETIHTSLILCTAIGAALSLQSRCLPCSTQSRTFCPARYFTLKFMPLECLRSAYSTSAAPL